MSKPYITKPTDTLTIIAKEFHFHDGGDAILNANPKLRELCKGNTDVIGANWNIVIPDLRDKQIGRSTDAGSVHKRLNQTKNMTILLLNDAGKKVTGVWKYNFIQGKQINKNCKVSEDGYIRIEKIDERESESSIEIWEEKLCGLLKFSLQSIELSIGGLDPIVSGKDGIIAIQKILVNLGYYQGEINGIIDKKTAAAVKAFRVDYMPGYEISGNIDNPFNQKLVSVFGMQFAVHPLSISENDSMKKNDKISTHSCDGTVEYFVPEQVTGVSGYEEPTNNNLTGPGKPFNPQHDRRKLHTLGKVGVFASKAYVAPYTAGEKEKVNNLRMLYRRFLFLDSGNFYGKHSNFSIIWGKHVYLCKFNGAGYCDETGDYPISVRGEVPENDRLDDLLFSAFGSSISIIKKASAFWAPYDDFDWGSIYLIIPDMHLMTAKTAVIWHESSPYKFERESQFLELAKTLSTNTNNGKLNILRNCLKIVQLGDSYDLWMDCKPCLFEGNDPSKHMLKIKDNSIPTISRWINDIKASGPVGSHINPAVEGLDILENTFGSITYIYGNHDNYLIDENVCKDAGITQRQRWVEYPGVFIEHGHRLESTFADKEVGKLTKLVGSLTSESGLGLIGGILQGAGLGIQALGSLPHNYDGDPSGYEATNKAFKALKEGSDLKKSLARTSKEVADPFAQIHDQPQYWGEFAQMWLGRAMTSTHKPPHIFVIGHTHRPNLFQIRISPWGV